MSTVVSIGLHTQAPHVPGAARLLLDRLLTRGELLTVVTYTKHPGQKQRVDAAQWVDRMESFIEQLLPSDNAVSLNLLYRLSDGTKIDLGFHCYGLLYDSGWRFRYDGHLRVSLSLNDIARPLQRLQAGGEQVPLESLGQAGEQAIQEVQALFWLVTGLTGGLAAEPFIEHSALYLETGWKAPIGCAMVYHRQAEDFAFDFIRIWAEYQMAVYMPTVYRLEDMRHGDKQALAASLADPEPYREASYIPYKNEYDDHKWMYAENKSFLESLAYGRAVHVYQSTRAVIRNALDQACAVLPRVEFQDLGARGCVLVSDPLYRLLEVYSFIAMRHLT